LCKLYTDVYTRITLIASIYNNKEALQGIEGGVPFRMSIFLLHVAVVILERKAFLSRFRGILCGYFLGHVAHWNFLPWQGLNKGSSLGGSIIVLVHL